MHFFFVQKNLEGNLTPKIIQLSNQTRNTTQDDFDSVLHYKQSNKIKKVNADKSQDPCTQIQCKISGQNEQKISDKEAKISRSQVLDACKYLEKHFQMDTKRTSLPNPFTFKNARLVLYNRVPKCGSAATFHTFRSLANHSHLYIAAMSYGGPKGNHGTKERRDRIAEYLINSTNNSQLPIFYARHLPFIDVTSLNLSFPAYVNVVREPLERVQSLYFYNRFRLNYIPKHEWKVSFEKCVNGSVTCPKTKASLLSSFLHYFSGGAEVSHYFRSRLKQAKSNIKRHFAVVGLTEDLQSFYKLMEYMFPDIFNGLVSVNQERVLTGSDHMNTGKGKSQLPAQALAIIKKYLWADFDLYDFIRQRFYAQLGQVEKHIEMAKEKKVLLSDCFTGRTDLTKPMNATQMLKSLSNLNPIPVFAI